MKLPLNKKQLIIAWLAGLFLLNGCATPGVIGVVKSKGTLTIANEISNITLTRIHTNQKPNWHE
jgi:uncharacterized lipoprotein YajG